MGWERQWQRAAEVRWVYEISATDLSWQAKKHGGRLGGVSSGERGRHYGAAAAKVKLMLLPKEQPDVVPRGIAAELVVRVGDGQLLRTRLVR